MWEALSSACILRLPVLFLVEDNDYAISVPVEVNTPGGSISNLLEGYHGLTVHEVDGCDPVASYQLFSEVVEGLRSGGGPVLVHAHVVRPYSHSLSDDERAHGRRAPRADGRRR